MNPTSVRDVSGTNNKNNTNALGVKGYIYNYI